MRIFQFFDDIINRCRFRKLPQKVKVISYEIQSMASFISSFNVET